MQQGTSKKIFTGLLIVLILVLVGVGVFIANKVSQNQAPSSSSADFICDWCEGLGTQIGSCGSTGVRPNYEGCATVGSQHLNCCMGHDEGGTTNPPPSASNKNLGDKCTFGQTDPANGGCDGAGPLNCLEVTCYIGQQGQSKGGYCWPGPGGKDDQSFNQWANTNVCSSGAGTTCSNPTGNYSQVNCDATCGSGKGRVCQADGTWSSCLNADACGFTGNKANGSACRYNSECSSGNCSGPDVDGNDPNGLTESCVAAQSNSSCSNIPGYSIGSFLGCGNVVAGGDGNSCHNCFAQDGSANSCNIWCDPNSFLSCGAKLGCQISSEIKYSCSGNSCVQDSNGTYTSSNCNNQCSPSNPPTNPPTNPTTAQCNEACSSTVPCDTGLSCASGVCRLPSNPTSPTCTPSTPVTPTTAQCNESCSDTVPCASGLSCTSGVCRLPSNPTSPTCTPSTPVQPGIQCIALDENGSDPLASGAGNFVIYTLTYQNPAATNPYPNIRLRVGTSGSPVGRDANHTTSTSVQAFNVTHDSVANTYRYQFKWEAATTAGSNVPAGTYNVRVLLDGTTEVTTPASCIESITLSQTAVEEPLFTILKQSAPVCEADGTGVVNYTITVTNIGSVPGTIDFVQDSYDSQIYSLGILPTSVNPSYGVVNTGKITWTGDNSQRTYTAGQAKTFTYTVRIPKTNLTTFTTTGLLNQAVVQYDTSTTNNNTASFDLRTFLTCTVTIPATGIIDDYKFILVGLLFIVLGLIVFRFRIGNQISLLLLDRTSKILNKQTEGIARKMMPYEESIMDEMERKQDSKK